MDNIGVLVVGGGASGVTSGIKAARMGISILVLEETSWLRGMLTSAGVSVIDRNIRSTEELQLSVIEDHLRVECCLN